MAHLFFVEQGITLKIQQWMVRNQTNRMKRNCFLLPIVSSGAASTFFLLFGFFFLVFVLFWFLVFYIYTSSPFLFLADKKRKCTVDILFQLKHTRSVIKNCFYSPLVNIYNKQQLKIWWKIILGFIFPGLATKIFTWIHTHDNLICFYC